MFFYNNRCVHTIETDYFIYKTASLKPISYNNDRCVYSTVQLTAKTIQFQRLYTIFQGNSCDILYIIGRFDGLYILMLPIVSLFYKK